LNGSVVFGLQGGVRDAGIYLRGARTAMSEQALERGKRQVRLRHAPAEGVTKLMAVNLDASFLTILLQNKLDAGDGEALPRWEMKTARSFVTGRLVSQSLSAEYAGGGR
jgi:hypothetical protein